MIRSPATFKRILHI